ncbi:dihydrolipoyl dehydrogenase [Halobacteria archaeon AArc-dxtr1]|nr:dihydrolipoyl dehydrogenase [Halobacteria archaeon AArc-dxtr1]
MKEYGVVVLGGGSGSQVATAAAEAGYEAAVVEPGPLGGACITRGCVPTKALIHRADLITEIQDADRFGIDAAVEDVRYDEITTSVHETVFEKAENQREALSEAEHVTLYEAAGRFVDERTIELADDLETLRGDDDEGNDRERIRGEHVVVAVGSRPAAPPIDGLDAVDYLTSDDALYLEERPDSLVIVGGGYIGAELGYFFGAVGTQVSIVGRSDHLVPREDEAASEVVERSLAEYCELYTGYEASAVAEDGDGVSVTIEGVSGEESETIEANQLLVAAGRKPNTDLLDLEATGLEPEDDGSIAVDDRLETDVERIWALGDVTGEYPFKHVADYESEIVAANVIESAAETVDYAGVPHAIFTSPQVASVGETESALQEAEREYESVTVEYVAAPMGMVLDPDDGFVKILAAPDGEVLGCHVVGPQASTLIHEVAGFVRRGEGTVDALADVVRVHPALNEVLGKAVDDLAGVTYSTAPDWQDVAGE